MNQNLKEDFLDILLYLFEYYSEDPDREPGNNYEIRKHLLGAGFEEKAIDHAMDWVEIFKDSSNKSKIVSPDKLSTFRRRMSKLYYKIRKIWLINPSKKRAFNR